MPPSVIATMRNVSRSGALVEAAGSALGQTLEVKQLDVCDEASIRACLDSIPGRRVDVLGEPHPCVALQHPTHGARAEGHAMLGSPHAPGAFCVWVTYPTQWGHPMLRTLPPCGTGDPPCQGHPVHQEPLGSPLGTLHARHTTVPLCQGPPFPGEPPSHTFMPRSCLYPPCTPQSAMPAWG